MTFANCNDAYNALRYNIPRYDADYISTLDRDHDGIACERNDATPAQKAKFTQAETSNGTKMETGAGVGNVLPKTGPGFDLGIGAGVLLAAGVLIVVAFRRREKHFRS